MRTKHIEIDYNFVRDKLLSKEISIGFVSLNDQLADILTKSLGGINSIYMFQAWGIQFICSTLRGSVSLIYMIELVVY